MYLHASGLTKIECLSRGLLVNMSTYTMKRQDVPVKQKYPLKLMPLPKEIYCIEILGCHASGTYHRVDATMPKTQSMCQTHIKIKTPKIKSVHPLGALK